MASWKLPESWTYISSLNFIKTSPVKQQEFLHRMILLKKLLRVGGLCLRVRPACGWEGILIHFSFWPSYNISILGVVLQNWTTNTCWWELLVLDSCRLCAITNMDRHLPLHQGSCSALGWNPEIWCYHTLASKQPFLEITSNRNIVYLWISWIRKQEETESAADTNPGGLTVFV